MKDLVFNGATVPDALAMAADTLGLPAVGLRYVVLERGELPQGRSAGTPARIVVLTEGAGGGGAPEDATRLPASPRRPADRLKHVAGPLNEALGVTVSRSADEKGEMVAVSPAPGTLPWGPTGEVFRALEHLLGRIAASEEATRPSRVVSREYREWRDARLEEEARSVALAVASDGQPRALPRLNAYERRVVHIALAGHEQVATRSVGAGEERELWIESCVGDEA
jgi:spoIIIJ-associated protein